MTNENAPRRQRVVSLLFLFLLFVSGFCGISYEILYARILGNILGDQFAVSVSVLMTFILGIGWGTLYAHRLWPRLWLIEAAIGACGAAFAIGTKALDRLLYAGLPFLGSSLAGSILSCLLLLGLPAFLVGCSLPLFSGYLSRLAPGRVFAKAYAAYNFGAALTALLIEFWLVRELGIRDTVLVVAALNLLVAFTLVSFFPGIAARPPRRRTWVRLPRRQLAALALAGTASAMFQLTMIKLGECLFGPFRETFALVLVIILLGQALGTALTRSLRLGFTPVLCLALAGLAWLLGGFDGVAHAYAAWYRAGTGSPHLSVLLKLGVMSLFMGLPALGFGATIPALLTTEKNVARESGQLLFVASMANALGFLVMPFLLHPYLDYGTLLLVLACLTGLSLAVFLDFRRGPVLAVAAVVAGAFFLRQRWWNEDLLYVTYASFSSPERLREAQSTLGRSERFKGGQDVFAINWIDGDPHFFINGYNSIQLNSPAEKLVGVLAASFSPRTDRALILGVGSGATAGTVGLLFDQVDAVEINRVVLDNLHRMSEQNFDLEHQPRVSLIHDDGIRYVKRSSRAYSLIVNTVTTPLYFSSSKLYTEDFLKSVRRRLSPDGVYATWLDKRVGDRGADIIVKTLSRSFRSCGIAAVRSAYFLLLCSQEELRARHPDLPARSAPLRRYLLEHQIVPEWIPYQMISGNLLEGYKHPRTPLNTLDSPVLEFEMARIRKSSLRRFKKWMFRRLSAEDLSKTLAPAIEFDPARLLLQLERILGNATLTRRWRQLLPETTPDLARRYRRAEAVQRRAYEGALDSADSRRRYGRYLLGNRRCAEAVPQFEKALAREPGLKGAHYDMARCYEKMGDLKAARSHYMEERKLDPDNPDPPYRLGRLDLRRRRYGKALRAFDTALSLGRDRRGTHLYRGRALAGLRRRSEAEAAYIEAAAFPH